MTRRERVEAGLLGAFVADAAALGFHWLYDPHRIADLAGDAPAFREPDASDFNGFKGVFVHPGKRAGALSQYGAQLRIALQSMGATASIFDIGDFQDRFATHFDAGGAWNGYIDKATRGTLENLRAGLRDPSGAMDDQVPAIARLPAIMANDAVMAGDVDAAIAVTSIDPVAVKWGPVAAVMLSAAYDGASPADAARQAAKAAPANIADALHLDSPIADTVIFAGEVGRACPLPQALPVICHICRHATSYRDAIERNILAGGDNCGRAPVLGAVFGAAYGVQGKGIPPLWLTRLHNSAEIAGEIDTLLTNLG